MSAWNVVSQGYNSSMTSVHRVNPTKPSDWAPSESYYYAIVFCTAFTPLHPQPRHRQNGEIDSLLSYPQYGVVCQNFQNNKDSYQEPIDCEHQRLASLEIGLEDEPAKESSRTFVTHTTTYISYQDSILQEALDNSSDHLNFTDQLSKARI